MDNRIENLELWVKPQPAGQRSEDLAEYARYLLSMYGTPVERAQHVHSLPQLSPLPMVA
jgi:hypothetical protein